MTAWTRLTAALESAPAGQVSALLRREAPRLVRQMRADREWANWRDCWGVSRNFDENARARIVAPNILAAIGREVACELPDDVAHAGFLHTYGYLLSNLRTPYGTKRRRWVLPSIDQGLQLRRKCIRAEPAAGTLFANVSWMLAQLALDADPREHLGVAPALIGLDWDALRRGRVRWVERMPRGGGRTTGLELHTTLVPLPGWPSSRADRRSLLIYAYRQGARAPLRLVTVFPIDAAGCDALWSQPLGDREDIMVRYNAAPPGVPLGIPVTGSRSRWTAAGASGWDPT